MICAASCSEHEIGGFFMSTKCSNETKQWGITSIKKSVCSRDFSISIIFTNRNMGSKLCGITICNGNDKR